MAKWRRSDDASAPSTRPAAYYPGKSIHGQFGTSKEARRKRNARASATRASKSELRTAVKKVKKAIATGDKAAATKTMHDSQAVMDRIADKKIVHKNLVSRTKSRLSSAIKALA